MDRTTLRDSIERVINFGSISGIGVNEVLAVAPHLERTEAVELVNQANPQSIVQFIGPPTLIRGCEHVYILNRTAIGVTLHHSGIYKRKEAFLGRKPDITAKEFDYRERVANYAETMYGDKLIWDKFHQVINYRIYEGTVPKAVEVAAGYKMSLTDMRKAITVFPMPLLQMMDLQLEAMSADPVSKHEIATGHMPFLATICGTCGGGITEAVCTVCHKSYLSLAEFGPSPVMTPLPNWDVPIHSRLQVEELLHKSPLSAIKRHYREWAHEDLDVLPPNETRHHRVITTEKK